MDDVKGSNYLALAPKLIFASGISFKTPSGFAGSIKTRYLGNRPANEDNSIVVKGYCNTDANLNYSYLNYTFGFITENIFNAKWNETQFATTSRLYNESQQVTEIHFTPGTPFNIKGAIALKF